MFERFQPDARAAVVAAQQQARAHGHTKIVPQHLLLGVLEVDGVGARVLRRGRCAAGCGGGRCGGAGSV